MGLRIKTNVESLVAQRQMEQNRSEMSDSLEKLSSGLRINKSADDAAGLAISESMRARIRGLAQAKRNANDGVSFLQVAEGGLGELNNILTRMRELTTQAASDTVGEKERSFLNREFEQLGEELTRIKDSTEFNGKKILSGEQESDLTIQVGASAPKNSDDTSGVVRIKFDNLSDLNQALADLPKEITGESGQTLGGGDTSDIFAAIDGAMEKVTDFRASLGAMQSRMNSTITAIDVSSENLSAASSRIRDVDYASETARLAQSKILTAASTSVLTQANQLPESVLTLLRG
ncbi:flagellin FliC [bacterium]|nr:flagellin FliC [bacterium]